MNETVPNPVFPPHLLDSLSKQTKTIVQVLFSVIFSSYIKHALGFSDIMTISNSRVKTYVEKKIVLKRMHPVIPKVS